MKKNKTKKMKQSYESNNQLMELFKIIIVLIVFLGVFYGVTLLKTKTNNTSSDGETSETSIQYDEILIGTMLDQSYTDYYVLVTDLKALDYSKYEIYVSLYNNDSKNKVFTSDTSSIFNKSYIGDSNVLSYVGKSSL